jgi:hypothetical protein
MPKYRKKPDTRIFEPEQYFRSASSLINSTKGVCQCKEGDTRGHVHTIHKGQVVDLEDGDWVMPEPDGEHFYPIKPDIFAATYEPVEATEEGAA